MTGLLASVNSVEETRLAVAGGADIIDLKNPHQGALGALPVSVIAACVKAVNHSALTSATIGDLTADSGKIPGAVDAIAATGVDFIKIGFFPNGGNLTALIDALSHQATHHRLIAVLFADQQPDFTLLPTLAAAGFHGVMLDTGTKNGAGLCASLPLQKIETFTHQANQHKLITGLAGQLTPADIPTLLPLKPDYLGFRSALCAQHNRTQHLNAHALQQIRTLIPVPNSKFLPVFG